MQCWGCSLATKQPSDREQGDAGRGCAPVNTHLTARAGLLLPLLLLLLRPTASATPCSATLTNTTASAAGAPGGFGGAAGEAWLHARALRLRSARC